MRTQLSSATELSTPASKAAILAMTAAAAGRNGRSGAARPRVHMFVSLDFEWWEKSSDTILEVGWSLWDTVTQRHRTRHWIIRENLNKVGGAAELGWAGDGVGLGDAMGCKALQLLSFITHSCAPCRDVASTETCRAAMATHTACP